MLIQQVSVIGAGSWGTALALLLARNGLQVTLYGRKINQWAAQRVNRYLSEIILPDTIRLTDNLQLAMDTQLVLFAQPSYTLGEFVRTHQAALNQVGRFVWACKGLGHVVDDTADDRLIERSTNHSTGELLSTVAHQALGRHTQLAVISGPNFAAEVAADQPTATTVAADSIDFAQTVAQCLHHGQFRAYSSTDLIGVQIAGALKNPLAIASGILTALNYGANAQAALLTRGMAEITRLGLAMGAQMDTFLGLAGMGDLVLTCTDNQSRNRRLGALLGQGLTLEAAMTRIGQAVEGTRSVQVACELAQRHGVELPIMQQVKRILYESLPLQQAVEELMSRYQKPERLR